MKTDYQTVKVTLHEGVAVLTLDNPPVNQMSPQLMQDFGTAMGEAMQDGAVKAIVLTGTGKNFIAGADITRLQRIKKKEDIFEPALEAARFLNGIEMSPKPIIAAINGNCLGGGLETAMACHYRIAAPGVNLGQPEVQIGLIPGAGGTQRLPRLVGLGKARELIYTGRHLKADEALAIGLADKVVPAEGLAAAALEFAAALAKGATVALGAAKQAVNATLGLDMEAGLAVEAAGFATCLGTEDAQEGLAAFLEKREAGFKGR